MIGGSAMTDWDCAKCGKHDVAGSTARASICKDCSKSLNLCEICTNPL